MPQYIQYISRNRIHGRDIINWTSQSNFIEDFKRELLVGNRRRLFVGVALERDGKEGTLVRTGPMYSILREYQVPYSVVHLNNARNHHLYDIIVVERGVTIHDQLRRADSMTIQRVSLNARHGDLRRGVIQGTGFQPGDTVLVNRQETIPTTFGGQDVLTFEASAGLFEGPDGVELQVIRPSSQERSNSYSLRGQ
jgi:hypothetical protein